MPTPGGRRHSSARWRSLVDLLDRGAEARPEAPAVSIAGAELSYRELAEASLRAARGLRAAGVGPGDRVAILIREACHEYLALALGAMRLGAICLAINARNKAHELRYVLEHGEPTVLAIDAGFAHLLATAEPAVDFRLLVVGADEGFEREAESTPVEEVAALSAELSHESHALLLYTSGTTANPKGCLLPHRSILAVGANCAERMELSAADRFWTPLPLFHVGGWQTLVAALSAGGCFSHVGSFEAGAALEQLAGERCTAAFPAFELIWRGVLEHPSFPERDLSALRVILNVGVPETLVRMQEALPRASQISCFGMTESGGSICMGAATDSLEQRTRTSGRPLPGVEIRVVEPAGTECEPGAVGELQFRGISAFDRYFRDPEATAATVLPGGWVKTGDLGCVDASGMVQFRGRLKEMLKVGGENASAPEIEGFLLTHPAVAVVAVVGAPDARYGEVPVAFVQKAPGQEVDEGALIEYCLGQIASFKVPRYVRFVDEYPTTASEKIKKFVLRETIEAELRESGVSEAPRPFERQPG